MQTRRAFFRNLFGAAAAIAVAPLVPLLEANGVRYPSRNSFFIPNFKGGCVVTFSRDPRKFKINRFTQIGVVAEDGTRIYDKITLDVETVV